eukprot:gene2793-3047_t
MTIIVGRLSSSKTLPSGSLLVKHGIVHKAKQKQLEHFFQSLQRDMFETKCEVQHCLTESTYRQAAQQQTVTQQTVQRLLAEVNLVKDFLYTDPSSSSSSTTTAPPTTTSSSYRQQTVKSDRLALLRGEIEGLKAAHRRLEVVHCDNLHLLDRLRALEDRLAHSDSATQALREEVVAGQEEERRARLALQEEVERVKQEQEVQQQEEEVWQERVLALEEEVGDTADQLREMDDSLLDLQTTTAAIVAAQAIKGGAGGGGGGEEEEEEQGEEEGERVERPRNPTKILVKRSSALSQASPRGSIARGAAGGGGAAGAAGGGVVVGGEERRLTSRRSLLRPPAAPASPGGGGGGGGVSKEEVEECVSAVQQGVVALEASLRDSLSSDRQAIDYRLHRLTAFLLLLLLRRYWHHRRTTAWQRWKGWVAASRESEAEDRRGQATAFQHRLATVWQRVVVREAWWRWRRRSAAQEVFYRCRRWLRYRFESIVAHYQPDLSLYIERSRSSRGSRSGSVGINLHRIAEEAQAEVERQVAAAGGGGGGAFESVVATHPPSSRSRSPSFNLARTSIDSVLGKNFTIANIKKVAYEDLQARWSFAEQQEEEEHHLASRLARYKDDLLDQLHAGQQPFLQRVEGLEEEVAQVKKSLHRAMASLAQEKEEVHSAIEQAMKKTSTEFNQYKSSITVKLSYLKESVDEMVKALEQEVHLLLLPRLDYLDQQEAQREKVKLEQSTELITLQRKLEQSLMAHEDVAHYLVLLNEEVRHSRDDVTTLTAKVNLFILSTETAQTTRQEEHSFLDEEVKWMKRLVEGQHEAMQTMRSSLSRDLREVRQAVFKAEDPKVLLKDYPCLIDSVVEVAKKVIAWQTIHQLFPSSSSTSATATIPVVAEQVVAQGKEKHWRVGLSLAVEVLSVARKVSDWAVQYSDQDVLLHHCSHSMLALATVTPSGLASSLQLDYSNDFLGLTLGQEEVRAKVVREKVAQKVVKAVEVVLAKYTKNSEAVYRDLDDYINEQNIVLSTGTTIPGGGGGGGGGGRGRLVADKSDLHKMKNSFLRTFQTILMAMLSSQPQPSLPQEVIAGGGGGGGRVVLQANSQNAANLAALCLDMTRHEASASNSDDLVNMTKSIVRAYESFRCTSPARQIVYIQSSQGEGGAGAGAGGGEGSKGRGSEARPKSAPLLPSSSSPSSFSAVKTASKTANKQRLASPEKQRLFPSSASPSPAKDRVGKLVEEEELTIYPQSPTILSIRATRSRDQQLASPLPGLTVPSRVGSREEQEQEEEEEEELLPLAMATASSSIFLPHGQPSNSIFSMGSASRCASPSVDGGGGGGGGVVLGGGGGDEEVVKKAVTLYLDQGTAIFHDLDAPSAPADLLATTSSSSAKFSHSIAMSAIVRQSAAPQQSLAQQLSSSLPMDRTFHAKHEEESASQQLQQEGVFVLQSRPLQPKHNSDNNSSTTTMTSKSNKRT